MTKKRYIIYSHINKINGKVYIGQTCQTLKQRSGLNGQWYKRCPKFWNGIKKYGWENFIHIILFKDLNKEMADIIEKQLIAKYDSVNNGYNLTSGGANGFELADETRQKISKSKIGKNNPMYGKRHPKEIQEKINESKKGKLSKKVINLFTNKVYNSLTIASEETGECPATISRHCNEIRVSNRHWLFYDDYLNTDKNDINEMLKQSYNCSKMVIHLETEIIYNSIIEASRSTNTDATLIVRHCKNKVENPKWEYFYII